MRTRYSTVAIVLHWSIAALILSNLYLGWRMGFLKGEAQFNVFELHTSIGLTVLMLSILRLMWRLVSPPPSPAGLKRWEQTVATTVHWAFYIIMIGMPLSGWIALSASLPSIPIPFYNLVTWPYFPGVHELPATDLKGVEEGFGFSHEILAFGSVALLALHLGAVAKHAFVDRNAPLARMLPRLGDPSKSES